MKLSVFAIAFLAACTPFQWKLAEDIIQGEEQVVEKIAEDVTGIPQPDPTIPRK
jgi:hypothetical protein